MQARLEIIVLIFQGEHHTGFQHPALLTDFYANISICVDHLPELQGENHAQDKERVPQQPRKCPQHRVPNPPGATTPCPRGRIGDKPVGFCNFNVPAAPRGPQPEAAAKISTRMKNQNKTRGAKSRPDPLPVSRPAPAAARGEPLTLPAGLPRAGTGGPLPHPAGAPAGTPPAPATTKAAGAAQRPWVPPRPPGFPRGPPRRGPGTAPALELEGGARAVTMIGRPPHLRRHPLLQPSPARPLRIPGERGLRPGRAGPRGRRVSPGPPAAQQSGGARGAAGSAGGHSPGGDGVPAVPLCRPAEGAASGPPLLALLSPLRCLREQGSARGFTRRGGRGRAVRAGPGGRLPPGGLRREAPPPPPLLHRPGAGVVPAPSRPGRAEGAAGGAGPLPAAAGGHLSPPPRRRVPPPRPAASAASSLRSSSFSSHCSRLAAVAPVARRGRPRRAGWSLQAAGPLLSSGAFYNDLTFWSGGFGFSPFSDRIPAPPALTARVLSLPSAPPPQARAGDTRGEAVPGRNLDVG